MKYANASKNVQKLLKVRLNWWLWLWDVCEYDNECLANQETNYKRGIDTCIMRFTIQWNRGTMLEVAH